MENTAPDEIHGKHGFLVFVIRLSNVPKDSLRYDCRVPFGHQKLSLLSAIKPYRLA